MQGVRVGGRALSGARSALLGAAPIAAAVVLSACGGSSIEPPAVGGGSNAIQPGSLGKLRCADWNEAGLDTRAAMVEELRAFAGGPVTGTGVQGRGAVLDDEQAYELFEGRCKPEFAERFLLVKLYTHAAGFAGH